MKLNVQLSKPSSERKGSYNSKQSLKHKRSHKVSKGAINKTKGNGISKGDKKAKASGGKMRPKRDQKDGNSLSHSKKERPAKSTLKKLSKDKKNAVKGKKGLTKRDLKPLIAVKKETKKSKEEERKDLNKLYSRLLVDHRKPEVVKSTISQLLSKLSSENYCLISNKRHVSRILQACLKYGDTSIRSLIFQRTKKDFSLLNLNVHSSRFLMKLYNYCNTEVKAYLKSVIFCDKGVPLLFSRYGSDLMDIVYQKLKNKEQLAILKLYALSNHFLLEKDNLAKLDATGSINQFAAIIDESKSRDTCVEKLKLAVLKMVDKAQMVASLSHDLVYLYWKLTDNKAELISHIHPVFGQLLSTRNGNAIMCDLFGYADKKMRKLMLKGLRTDFPDAVYNQINVSFLIKAIHSTDDTKLSIDCLIKPIQDDLKTVISDKYAHAFILSIFEPPKDMESPTSLKDPVVRQQELKAYLLPLLVDMFKSVKLRDSIEDKSSSKVLLAVLRESDDAAIFHSVMDEIREDITEEMDLIKNIDTLRFIQTLVKKPGPVLERIKPYAILWPIVKVSVHRILEGKCVFLLVDILEAAIRNKDEEVIADFKGTVTPAALERAGKSLIKKNEKHIGLDILIKLLKE